ncbi:hypothetical protein SCP_1702870 [Sparassis crispa]|uniref:CxC2-like cysteine cluster KDZ transposase-associated domain-containing protein n=1 Tax=Sparassis crispa TaxID=139825 RepID=A0A401H6F0_9APHY|nr:hypothetical protein SCP_1702870 [Sparassis crispa]GBE89961.1 hypothetical protein SCP_1702870 [Sparassis crispa]
MFASLADKMNPWNKLKSYCCAVVYIMTRKKRTPNVKQFTILEETTDGTNYNHYIVPRTRNIVRHMEYVSVGNKVSARTSFYTASTTDAGDKDAPSFDLSELCRPTSDIPDNDEDVDLFDLDPRYLEDVEKLCGHKPRRRSAGDHPLQEWVPEIDNYLAEMLRLEGRYGFDTGCCQFCKEGPAMVHSFPSRAGQSGFITLIRRLRIQLGHPVGHMCRLPVRATGDDFIVLCVNGIHEVGLDFSTSTNPKTAATFQLCRYTHLLMTQSKTSGYEFYQSLARLTDNTGVQTPKDRRGHDPDGVKATTPGSCAVLCPACLHPGKNLPPDWEDAPDDQKWLYRLFVGLNANFRLKRKKESAYKEYLGMYDSLMTEEQSTCNSHDAVKLANMRGSIAGTAASRVGAATCTRHDMRLPCSVGDLQKGERYVNMDYIFFSALANSAPKNVVVSYDIACQWHRNLWKWYHIYEDCPFKKDDQDFVFLIPKFHINAHQDSCQTSFSFHNTPHVGETDDEGVERPWSDSNLYSLSTKEMGPGSRHNFLDDTFADYNWRKICGMPALPERNEQVFTFAELNSAITPKDRGEWTTTIEAWEKNPSQTNPFVVTCPAVTQAAVRLQLANEEAAELENGECSGIVYELPSLSMMIMVGMELQEQQYRLR